MVIFSPESKKEYLSAVKEQRESWFSFGSERFTGRVIGSLFCITYHMKLDRDRRNPKTTAVGFVKEAENGCTVHCLLLRGFLRPQLLPLVLLALVATLWAGTLTRSALVWSEAAVLWIALGTETWIAIDSESGRQSGRVMKSFLMDPSDPYSHT